MGSRLSSASSAPRRWANGGTTPNFAPARQALAGFARAAATRYRWVTQWLIWNEPNQARWLRPTSPSVYVRRILNPGYAAIDAVNPRAKVAGGVTAPRGSSGGVSPVAVDPRDARAGARLDAYAHHPYPSSTRETPFAGGCGHCETITMATLERLLVEVGRAFGPKRIWLTEYGYQTGAYGVTQQRQAELIGQSGLRVHKAPRVDMLIHYLVKDEPAASRFQSGLFNISGRRSSLRSRSRSRSRRPDGAAASSSSGARCARAAACRPTASRCARAGAGGSAAAPAGRRRAASSARRSLRRAARHPDLFTARRAYSATIRAR